ncbi:hypothetical protein GCM10027064_06320 [Microbacterium petrolearium]
MSTSDITVARPRRRFQGVDTLSAAGYSRAGCGASPRGDVKPRVPTGIPGDHETVAEAGGTSARARVRRGDERSARMSNGTVPPVAPLDDPLLQAMMDEFEEDEHADGW